MTGRALIHASRYWLRLDRAATQTSLAERETVARFAQGRRRALEIGVFEGATTALIAQALAPDGKLFAVDPFFPGRMGICWSKFIARREVRRAGIVSKVIFVRSLSHDAAAQLKERAFDFIFIDGDHSREAIMQDWTDWSGRIAPDGVILLHDTQVPAHNPLVRELGSYLYFQETISRDPRFQILETVDSLTVLGRA
jgi:predicted O-methyltransferase YrrM